MTPDQMIFLIPIVAIVMSIGNKMLNRVLEHQAKLAEMNGANRVGSESLRADIDGLRREIASLRETSTQYDLSLQKVLENVDQRVTHIESRLRQPVTTMANAPEEQQQLNAGR